MTQELFLQEFSDRKAQLQKVLADVEKRLAKRLAEVGLKLYSLEGRLKTGESLAAKLARPDITYRNLWNVTDTVGLRITTFFEDELEQVAAVIEGEFAVDFKNSVNKGDEASPNQFGYLSLHYICHWNNDPLPADFRFEIQVRTVLQHAWAEIEHDLGYKASDAIPNSIRRRFSRIAGLLELADQEFVSIRSDLKDYEDLASKLVATAAVSTPLPLDLVSLRKLLATEAVAGLDREIAGRLNVETSAELFYLAYLLKMLKLAGYRDISTVRADLEQLRGEILLLVPAYFKFTTSVWKLTPMQLGPVKAGYALFFLAHVAILRSSIRSENKIEKLAGFYRELDYPKDESSAYEVAKELLAAIEQ